MPTSRQSAPLASASSSHRVIPVERPRRADGFLLAPPRLAPRPTRTPWPQYGAQVLTSLGPNLVDDAMPLRWRGLAVHFRDAAGELAGHAQMWLLQCHCPLPESRCVQALGQLDEENIKAGIFGERLLETCAHAPALLSAGFALGEFAWLEMHPERVRPGTGLVLGQELMALAARRYRCVAFMLRPFSLHFDLVLDGPHRGERASSWVRLEHANQRLSRAYCHRWAARPVSDDSAWLVCGPGPGSIGQDAIGHWAIRDVRLPHRARHQGYASRFATRSGELLQ